MPSIDEPEPLRDDPFPELKEAGDPALRLVAWLIRAGDFRQLEQRTGLRRPPDKPVDDGPEVYLPALIRLDAGKSNAQTVEKLTKRFGIPTAYREAMKDHPELKHVTARLPLGRTKALFFGESKEGFGLTDELVRSVSDLRAAKATHVSLGAPGQPSRKRSELASINVPDDRVFNNHALSGERVVVGIIDDGCALAHVDFLKPRNAGAAAKSRILYLWDQAGTSTGADWTAPPDFDGKEVSQAAIDRVLAAHTSGGYVNEEAVYRQLGYRISEVSTHGTHVMGTAAGTGLSVMGAPGIAPGADIIFVQLPASAIEGGATVLWQHILDGVAYIFSRAQGAPTVVNISYGGYDGPHDGTSPLEQGLDEMLALSDRAIVLAAGNGFEARCHASVEVLRNGTASLRWIVGARDPTANTVEFWYEAQSTLQVRFSTPGAGIDPAGWIQLGQSTTPITRTSDGKTIGYVEHLPSGTGNGANRIVLTLNATDAAAANGAAAPSPSGTWKIEFKHAGGKKATVHGWIWRDDAGRPRDARLRQSRFHPDDASPEYSIGGWATGQRTISVGAFNAATLEVCRYSACGPTRDDRPKPEIYAPAEDDVRGRGVLSTSARSARPRRMNGTSVAAPYVTGMIALMMEYALKYARNFPVHLSADQIARELKNATKKGLKFNRRQAVDKRVPDGKKQKDVRAKLLDTEKADFIDTMKNLPQ